VSEFTTVGLLESLYVWIEGRLTESTAVHYVHGPTTNPQIYSKATTLPWAFWIEIAKTDAAALYAVVAQASVHRLMLQGKSLNLDDTGRSGKLSPENEANFYLFKTMRLLQKKFDDSQGTLSNASVFVAAALTACVVSTSLSLMVTDIPKNLLKKKFILLFIIL
jgi:hypothetical protein